MYVVRGHPSAVTVRFAAADAGRVRTACTVAGLAEEATTKASWHPRTDVLVRRPLAWTRSRRSEPRISNRWMSSEGLTERVPTMV